MAFLLVLGMAQSFSYFNSFDANVRLTGLAAGIGLSPTVNRDGS